MRINSKTISQLAAKGIEVKYYPTGLEGLRRDTYQKRIDYVKGFHDGQKIFWHEHYIDQNSSDDEISAYAHDYVDNHLFMGSRDFDRYESRRWYDATTLYICYDGKTIVKKENQKSKEITLDYVEKLIEKQERAYQGAYGQFALDMQRLLSENGLQNRISIYPTTYGIGVWVFYNWSAKKDIERVTAIMQAKGIDYENEYSEAGWVYRYKVSKRADNLAKVAA